MSGDIVVRADTAQYSCTIGGQKFSVLSFSAREEMSTLSRFQLNLWSDNPQVNIKGLLRQAAEIKIKWDEKVPKEKTFYGIVASMIQTVAGEPPEVEKPYGHYACEVVPTLWLLGRKGNTKMFQEMPAEDIIDEVLSGRGMAGKYEWRISRGCRIREFCLQYRETDLAFVSRLMDEEGMYYWFDHNGEEKMIIGDSVGGYGTCWPETNAIYRKGAGGMPTPDSRPDLEYLSDLVYEESAYTGKFAYRDWNYREPEKPPERPEAGAPDNTDLEFYDYDLERYLIPAEGTVYAQMEVDSHAAMRKVVRGSGTFRSITCGSIVTIEEAYRGDLDGDWVIVSLNHSAHQTASTGVDYSVAFTAIPADTVFRPLHKTPRPRVTMQTATVTGPPGAEIYMDKYGRAKVQFHWDLDHNYEVESSCWIRVAQHYAGMKEDAGIKHGFHWHPLVDDEVIVDFLEGDPDNPIITGSVFNYVKMPIVKPEEHIRNVILTRYQHQLLFDDKNKAITLNTPYPHTLKMDDPAKKITLDTNYQHQLEMWDPHKDNDEIPSVQLKTGGNEVIRMEDDDETNGNNIKISTEEGHHQHFLEGKNEKGIIVQTHDGHFMKMKTDFQGDKGIEIRTSQNHRVWMDDVERTIVVTSKDQHRIQIDDKNQFIEVADSSGQQRFHIDIKKDKITIENKTGDIDVLAPKGTVKIDAKAVDVKAQTSVKIDCNNMSTKATTDVKVKAAKIEEKAQMSIKMEAMQISSKASMKNETKGMMVESKAGAMNTIKGCMVRIN
jgi:type VI secretion system VgrG family protein